MLAEPTGRGSDGASERVSSLITSRGGEIVKVDTWGRRRMAYPIKRNVDGYYTILRFRLEPRLTEEVDRNLRLMEQVLRHLVVHAEEVPSSRPIRKKVNVVQETKE